VARVLIISPHNDDAAIGCYLFLTGQLELGGVGVGSSEVALLVDRSRGELRGNRYVEVVRFAQELGLELVFDSPEEEFDLVLAPSPESSHPLHKYWAWRAIDFKCKSLAYYSVDMREWWVRPLPLDCALKKREFLDKYFPAESELWRFDAKYFLFEGYVVVGYRGWF